VIGLPPNGGIKKCSQRTIKQLVLALTSAANRRFGVHHLKWWVRKHHHEIAQRGVTMAFVRKKGKSYYLVHNVREDGRVRQVHLACLGNRPRVNDEVIKQVQQSHPDLQIDWDAVRNRASESFASPLPTLKAPTS
jgi:hypothetical protein